MKLMLLLLYWDTSCQMNISPNVMEKHNSKNIDLLSDIKMDSDDMETYKISFKIRIKHNQEAQLKKLVNYLHNDTVVSSELPRTFGIPLHEPVVSSNIPINLRTDIFYDSSGKNKEN